MGGGRSRGFFWLLRLSAFAAVADAFSGANLRLSDVSKTLQLRSSFVSPAFPRVYPRHRVGISARCEKLRLGVSMNADAARDELIDRLASAAPYELPSLVSQNLKEISQPALFLRLAALNDETNDPERKQKLAALADNLVATLEAVVKRTEERMDSASVLIQAVVSRAAEADGEFIVPLKADRIAAMRTHISNNLEHIDDGFLSTVLAYMKKANDDGLEGMVVILQKVLQLWAASDLIAAGPQNAAVTRLLEADPDGWDGIIQSEIGGPNPPTDKEALVAAVQSCVEKVVLQKASGSHGQRVEAEFLRELIARIRKAPDPSNPELA